MANENWWNHDPEGLREKLEIYEKQHKTPEEIAKMYSHGKRVPVKKIEKGQLKMGL